MGIKVDRSVIEGNSIKLFKAAIRSRQTLDSYERKLVGFLLWTQIDSDSFVNLARQNPKEAENKIIDFIISEKGRIDRREIVAGTLAYQNDL